MKTRYMKILNLRKTEHDFNNNKMKKERKLIYNISNRNAGRMKTTSHTLVNNE